MLPLGVWVVVIIAMRSEGDNPKSMEGVLGDRAYHLAADHHIHHHDIQDTIKTLCYTGPSLIIIASRTQFHVERPWGQRPFSIVS